MEKIPAEAPAAALQRTPLGLILGAAAWASEEDMAAAGEIEEGGIGIIGGAIDGK